MRKRKRNLNFCKWIQGVAQPGSTVWDETRNWRVLLKKFKTDITECEFHQVTEHFTSFLVHNLNLPGIMVASLTGCGVRQAI